MFLDKDVALAGPGKINELSDKLLRHAVNRLCDSFVLSAHSLFHPVIVNEQGKPFEGCPGPGTGNTVKIRRYGNFKINAG